jgi:hypothetical protein
VNVPRLAQPSRFPYKEQSAADSSSCMYVQAFFVIKGAGRDFSPEDLREQID